MNPTLRGFLVIALIALIVVVTKPGVRHRFWPGEDMAGSAPKLR
jgi:hypothetical protein